MYHRESHQRAGDILVLNKMGEDKTGASQRAGQPGPRGAENVGLTRPLNTILLERIEFTARFVRYRGIFSFEGNATG